MRNWRPAAARRSWSPKTIRSSALRVVRRLESLGYTVIAAVAGDEALEKLRANPGIDMLFTDIIMPGGMSGWELADLARHVRSGLPVVFSSGYALETLVEKGLASARSIVLTKPYRRAELARRIREALAAGATAS